jgi:UDP-N-acetylmuramate--alanine ligase
MIAYVLQSLGLDPSYILGGKLKSVSGDPLASGKASKLGASEYLVIEADESDGSFQRYHPHVGVITNIDEDHLDFYGDMAAVENAFLTFLKGIPPDGFGVMFWDHPRVLDLAQRAGSTQRLAYGSFLGCDVRLLSFIQVGTTLTLRAMIESEMIQCRLPLIGRHNAFNGLATLSVCKALEIPIEKCVAALEAFPGVIRRLDLYFEGSRQVVYYDYAHNPVKMSSCLEGLREAFPTSQIIVIFQAHRYSRLQHMYHAMLSAFKVVNTVLVVPVYAAGEAIPASIDDERFLQLDQPFSTQTIANEISTLSGVQTYPCESLNQAQELLQLKLTLEHSVFITLGAGDVWTVARDFALYLQGRS